MTSASSSPNLSLEQSIKNEARRLGFVLAGVTTPDPPPHVSILRAWLKEGLHGSMQYMADARALQRRADPRQLLPGCRSILVLATPYSKPDVSPRTQTPAEDGPRGRVAAYAWGRDYHDVIPRRLAAIVAYIEQQVGHAVASRVFTDSAPVLERDLAQRAGLGWIGKNTCLINPKAGSYLLLGEILLDMDLKPDEAFVADQCGKCTRCIEACPTACIRSDRTLDARKCISYLSIELKGPIPEELRPRMADWIFGCDICQTVCPWNRFAEPEGDESFRASGSPTAPLLQQLQLSPEDFSCRYKGSAITRAKHAGYRRNVAVALGNTAGPEAIPVLNDVGGRGDPLVQEHARWAAERIRQRLRRDE